MGNTAQQQAVVKTRQPIPAVASPAISPERIERMWKMTAQERVVAARQGKLTFGEMLRWAARRPHEVDLVDGEFWFITALLADTEDQHGNLWFRAVTWMEAVSSWSCASWTASCTNLNTNASHHFPISTR